MSNKIDLLTITKNLVDELGATKVAERLNLARGTVLRWIDLKNVPIAYQFDLMKLAGINIDYSLFSSKEKDQFFTSKQTAKYCYEVFLKKVSQLGLNERQFNYIEPSAGSGVFLQVLPSDRITAFDIEPQGENIIKQDYLDWTPVEEKKYVIFGNPPFGLRGHMALNFINHSSNFCDFVCFILPQLFESDGKGVPRKRVKGLNLIHSEKIISNFYDPDNKEIKINTIFQIWSKNYKDERYEIKETKLDWLKIYSLSDGGTSSSTRNKKMLDKCDVYLPSTCFGKDNMRYYDNFENLPGRKGYGLVFNDCKKQELIEFCKQNSWGEVSFLSTNSAYNLRMSKIKEVLIDSYKEIK